MSEKHKILIVDDNEANRELLIDMLEDDFDVYQCADGKEAIAVISNQGSSFSLVLLDIFMPEVDGFQVLKVMNKLRIIEDLPVIMISSESSPESMEHAYRLGATDYIPRPFNMMIVRRRVINTIMLYSKQKKLIETVEEQVEEKEKNSEMLINILSHIVEFRNGESGLHVLHVRRITEILLDCLTQKTDKYALTKSTKAMIANASALHDIGKISIPDSILNKPGRLTDEEYAIMKTHSAAGGDLVNQLPIYKDEPLVRSVFEICRWHHERFDGRGYPDGLKGDEIPISAQVVAVADVYDALTSERCYKKAFTHEKAVEMILNNECGVFNPMLMECLIDSAEMIKSELSKDMIEEIGKSESRLIAQEILENKNISRNDLLSQSLKYEREKNEFYNVYGSDLIFEYITKTDMLIFSDKSAELLDVEKTIMSPASNRKLLDAMGIETHKKLEDEIYKTTAEATDGQCDLQSGDKVWRIVFRTLWSDGSLTGTLGLIRLIDQKE